MILVVLTGGVAIDDRAFADTLITEEDQSQFGRISITI